MKSEKENKNQKESASKTALRESVKEATKKNDESTEILSARVPKDIAHVFNSICEENKISKSKFLTHLITNNYLYVASQKNLNVLEKILYELKFIVPENNSNYRPGLILPAIIEEEDENDDYFGKLQILVGDDTVIRQDGDLFYIIDFHDKEIEKARYNAEEVLDYYKGAEEAYSQIVDTWEEKSIPFLIHYISTAESKIEWLREHLEKLQKEKK